MPDISLGDYEIDDNSNGDLVIKDPNDNIVMRWDETNANWNLENQSLSNIGSVTTDESVTVTGGEATETLHYGDDQDRANAGDYSVAVGFGARAPGDDGAGGSIDRHVAIGYQAAQNNTGNYVTAAGFRAAQNNTGDRVTASGFRAAQNNEGINVTAAGYNAARGDELTDPTTMGDDNIGIGENAIRNNQASGLIAIGQDAGINAQTDDQLIITQRDGTRRMVMDLTTGDLQITGSITENATL